MTANPTGPAETPYLHAVPSLAPAPSAASGPPPTRPHRSHRAEDVRTGHLHLILVIVAVWALWLGIATWVSLWIPTSHEFVRDHWMSLGMAQLIVLAGLILLGVI